MSFCDRKFSANESTRHICEEMAEVHSRLQIMHSPGLQSIPETEMDPYSPGSHSVDESGRKRKKGCAYNRNTVKVDEYLTMEARDINAKEMRTLLPAMFQQFRFPDKSTSKTKVKGLWDLANKPDDLPNDITFKDPNNATKMPNDMMKRFFNYLKQKLNERSHMEVRQEPMKQMKYQEKEPTFHFSVPKIPDLEEFKEPINGFRIVNREYTAVPCTVDQIKSEDMDAAATIQEFIYGQSMDASNGEFRQDQPDSTLSELDVASPRSQAAVAVFNEVYIDPSNCVTHDFTIMHNVPMDAAGSIDETLTFQVNEHSMTAVQEYMPMQPETVHPDSQYESRSVQMAKKIEKNIVTFVNDFQESCNTPAVNNVIQTLINDVVKPKLNAAYQGNIEECGLLVKLSSRFEESLSNYVLYECESKLTSQLQSLIDEFATVIPGTDIPTIGEEIQVYNVTADVKPVLMNARDPYIPTIAGFKDFMKQCNTEGMMIKEECEDKRFDHFVEKLLGGITDMDIDDITTSPEELGIKLTNYNEWTLLGNGPVVQLAHDEQNFPSWRCAMDLEEKAVENTLDSARKTWCNTDSVVTEQPLVFNNSNDQINRFASMYLKDVDSEELINMKKTIAHDMPPYTLPTVLQEAPAIAALPIIPTTVLDTASISDDEEPPCKKKAAGRQRRSISSSKGVNKASK